LPEGLQSPAALQTLDDDLFVQLFDETVVDLMADDRERDVSVHQRYERHWLGGIRIPFASVYKWNKVIFEKKCTQLVS
jgi:coiled-coil and C2 domain-containing protein 2A